MICPNCKLALAGLIIPACFGFQMYHFIMINPAQEMFKVSLIMNKPNAISSDIKNRHILDCP